jgi:transposase
VTELAESLEIELLYLPPYSPNLNLIERLWKFVKKKYLYAKYYEDFTQFSSAISEYLEDANVKYKEELDSLLTLRFQRFDKSQIMNV